MVVNTILGAGSSGKGETVAAIVYVYGGSQPINSARGAGAKTMFLCKDNSLLSIPGRQVLTAAITIDNRDVLSL